MMLNKTSSKSGCRYGRRSNWFKIHCIMQKNAAGGPGGKTSSPVSSATSHLPYPPQSSPHHHHRLSDSLSSLASLQQQHTVGGAPPPLFRGFPTPTVGKFSLSRSPSPLNTSTETLSVQSSPSPAASTGHHHIEAPVSPPTSANGPLLTAPLAGLPGLNFAGLNSSGHSSPVSPLHPLLLPHLQQQQQPNYDMLSSSSPSLLDQSSLYKLSPLLAVHPLLLAANPLFKLDFNTQIELLKQRRAMFEAMKSEEDSIEADEQDEENVDGDSDHEKSEEGGDDDDTKPSVGPAEAPIDLSCK